MHFNLFMLFSIDKCTVIHISWEVRRFNVRVRLSFRDFIYLGFYDWKVFVFRNCLPSSLFVSSFPYFLESHAIFNNHLLAMEKNIHKARFEISNHENWCRWPTPCKIVRFTTVKILMLIRNLSKRWKLGDLILVD